MDRIRNLETYQKVIILFLAVIFLFFTVFYAVFSAQKGILYGGSFFRHSLENGNVLYSGKVGGVEAVFTVTESKSVTLQFPGVVYGPYTVKEDPTAVSENYNFATGIEVYEGDILIFRGSVHKSGGSGSNYLLFDENGELSLDIIISDVNGTAVDGNGNVIDTMKPSIEMILQLIDGPELDRRCEWFGWFLGLFCSVVLTVSILFADEIFRWNLSFRIRDAEFAEPSDWEIGSRFLGWVCLGIMAFVAYIMGLC